MTDETIIYTVLVVTGLLGTAALYTTWKSRRRWKSLVLLSIGMTAYIITATLFWYIHRPLPSNISQPLFEGVNYTREVIDGPVVIHTVYIDLDSSGISFMVTPAQSTANYTLSGKTTSQFLQEQGLQIAINGDFFDPWHDNLPWDYYPRIGEGVNVHGLSISQGDYYTDGYAPTEHYASLFLTKDNQASFTLPNAPVYNAISGNMMLMRNGQKVLIDGNNEYLAGKHPRCAIGLDASTRELILLVVDGRQPNYSEGVTIPEFQQILSVHGAVDALNLDGGGSVTLAIEGADGLPVVLNSPIHSRIPGRERPVANHFGVFAQPLGA